MIILCLAILALFVSTTFHTVSGFIYYKCRYLLDLLWSGFSLWLTGMPLNFQEDAMQRLNNISQLHSCARVSTMAVNVRAPYVRQSILYSLKEFFSHR